METAKTVDQAMTLLRALAEEGPASAAELAARVGCNRTVAHRLLVTLAGHGAVRRDDDDRWTLGLGLAELGGAVARDVRDAARGALEQVAAETGETALLAMPDGDEAVAVDQVVASQAVQVRYRPGFRHPLSRGAHGLAILAFAGPETVSRAAAHVEDPGDLRDRLAAVRRNRVALSHDELQLGAAGVAAPVFDGVEERVVASLGVVAPLGRLPAGTGSVDAVDAVRRAADTASAVLGSGREPQWRLPPLVRAAGADATGSPRAS